MRGACPDNGGERERQERKELKELRGACPERMRGELQEMRERQERKELLELLELEEVGDLEGLFELIQAETKFSFDRIERLWRNGSGDTSDDMDFAAGYAAFYAPSGWALPLQGRMRAGWEEAKGQEDYYSAMQEEEMEHERCYWQ